MSEIEFTEEQLEMIHKLEETLQPVIECISKLFDEIKTIFLKVYENLKTFLSTKISIKSKSYKKGKKYIHSYRKLELWKYVRRLQNE